MLSKQPKLASKAIKVALLAMHMTIRTRPVNGILAMLLHALQGLWRHRG